MNDSKEQRQRPNITCESKLDVIEQRIVWTIDKYSVRSKQNKCSWKSSYFEFKGINDVNTKWELQLFPFGEDYSSYVAFKLYNRGSNCPKVFYEVSVRGINDTKLHASTPPAGATSISSASGCCSTIQKFILSARSPVFEAMLKTKMKELESGSIAIDDFSKNVVEKMLVYIYGGMVPNVGKDAKELLNIAEKYQLQQMKISLGEKLVSILHNDNCIEYLAVGDLLHVKKLKDAALKYFKQNVNSIVNKENWKEGLNNLPAMLGWEIMEEVLKK